MQTDLQHTLLNRQQIAERLDALAKDIQHDLQQAFGLPSPSHPHNTLSVVPIMTGSFIFAADLLRRLPLRTKIYPITASSYPGTATRSLGVTLHEADNRAPSDLAGQHVLLIDDILDSGSTLQAVSQTLKQRNPASLHTCVLLRKQRDQALACPVDYVAFEIPDEFVVGYGLDYDDQYRNLPDICTLRPEIVRG